jgi:FKBP-type peptidyl-prolyl cis-trans isomerase
MKTLLSSSIVLSLAAALVPLARAQDKAPATTPATPSASASLFKDQREKLSYSYGLYYGNSLKRQAIDLDIDVMAKGLKDAMSGAQPLLTETEARTVMMEFQKELRAKEEEKNRQIGEKNKKEGDEFLAANAKKEGVKTLPSGLQYKVVTAGTGPTPKATDSVTTHYKGTLIDGTEFDSSYKRGQPSSFAVTGVIRGWTEALQLMSVGSKWQLFIPSSLAYGERGAGRNIGPNSTLIFELELLGIKEPDPAAAAAATPKQPVTSDIIKVPSAEELKKGAKIEVIKADSVEKKN